MIPKKVKIGCFEYDVKITNDALILNNKAGHAGLITYSDLEIKIDSNMAIQQQEQTFWHEVCHGIVDYFDLDLGDNLEKVIEVFSKGFYNVLKDNNCMLPGQKYTSITTNEAIERLAKNIFDSKK